MKRVIVFSLISFTLTSALVSTSAWAASFTSGRVVVLQVNGTSSGGNSGALVEFDPANPGGAATATVALPYNGGVNDGTSIAFDEYQYGAAISLSDDGALIAIPGYANAFTSLKSSASSDAPRIVATVKYNGSYARGVTNTGTAFSGQTFRGAASDGFGNFWASAGGGFTRYLGTHGDELQVQTLTSATRDIVVVGGKLYTCGDNVAGGYGVRGWDGAPPITGTGANSLIINAMGTGSGNPNANGLAIGTAISYVGDLRTTANGGGVQRYHWDEANSAWVYDYTMAQNGTTWNMGGGLVQNIAADFSGANPVIYVTSSTGNGLWAITDNGAATTYTAATLAVPTSGTVFRGVALSPRQPSAPVFTTQPQGQTNFYGATVSFGPVEASGADPYGFTWMRYGTNLVDDARITGSRSNVLTISNIGADDQTDYYAVAHNNGPTATTSTGAYLKLKGSCINPNLSPVTLCAGGNAVFTAGTSGCPGPLTMSWTWNNGSGEIPLNDGASPSGSGATISGATTASLTITNAQLLDAGTYTITVLANGEPSVSIAPLTVAEPVGFMAYPLNQDKVAGQTATFTVQAIGNAIAYQWKKNGSAITDGPSGTGSIVGGAHTASLGITNVQSGDIGSYTCTISNVCGSTLTSDAATLMVGVAPVVGPLNNSINVLGSDAAFSAVVTAGSSPLTYTWKHNGTVISSDGIHIFGAESPNLGITGVTLDDRRLYSLTVTNAYGSASVSAYLFVITETNKPNDVPNLIVYEPFDYPLGPNPAVGFYSWENIISIYNRVTGEPAYWINTGNGLYAGVASWNDGSGMYGNPDGSGSSLCRNGGNLPAGTAGGRFPYPGLDCSTNSYWFFSSSGCNNHLRFGGVTNGCAYFSFIFWGDQGSAVNNGSYDVVAGFTSGNSDANGANANNFAYALCTKADTSPGEDNPGSVDGPGGWRFGVFKGGGIAIGAGSVNGQWAPLHCWRGHPYLVVGCYKIVSGGTTVADDVLSLWVEPPISSFGADENHLPPPDAGGMTTNWNPNAPITEFSIRATLNTSPFSKRISDLRIGKTWASVTYPHYPTLHLADGPASATLSWPVKDTWAKDMIGGKYGYQLETSADLVNWTRYSSADYVQDGLSYTVITNKPITPQFWRLQYPARSGLYWQY